MRTSANWHIDANRFRVFGICALAALWPAAAQAQDVNMDDLRRVLSGESIESGAEEEFTEEFFLEETQLVPRGRNMFFSLEPGYQLHLGGVSDGEQVELFITVLRETRTFRLEIDGRMRNIKTRVIEEREYIDGELLEISRNYYSRCTKTNNIFYFGEDVCFFENDQCVGTGGSWLAGVSGATPGVIMPGSFLLGARYFQEQAPGVAMDRAEHVEMGVDLTVPAGALQDCVVVLETTPLEPDSESEKVYAPEIGLVKDGDIELIEHGFEDKDPHKD